MFLARTQNSVPPRVRLGNTTFVSSIVEDNITSQFQYQSNSFVSSTPVPSLAPVRSVPANNGNGQPTVRQGPNNGQPNVRRGQNVGQPMVSQNRRPLSEIQNHAPRNQENRFIFSKPMNVLNQFNSQITGSMISDELQDNTFQITKGLIDETVNFALKLLQEDNNNKLDLGKRKKQVLANVAIHVKQSLVTEYYFLMKFSIN